MSIESMSLVLNHSRARGTAKLVLLGIANHDGDGGAWPTHATLARYANVNERNVRAAIRKLIDLGEVRVEVQRGGTVDWEDHRRPNRYIVLVSCPPWCDRTKHHRDTRKRHGSLAPIPTLSTGGSLATPVEGEGGSLATPVRGSDATPKPSTEPMPHEVVPQLQAARASLCSVCGQDEWTCQRQQTHWSPDDRHLFASRTICQHEHRTFAGTCAICGADRPTVEGLTSAATEEEGSRGG